MSIRSLTWLSRSRHSTLYPHIASSIGESIGIIDGKDSWWEAVGPALETFKSLEKDIETQLGIYCGPIPGLNRLTFSLYMIGDCEETASPTIIFSCPDPGPRKAAMYAMKKSGILKRNPGFKAGNRKQQPGIHNLIYPASKLRSSVEQSIDGVAPSTVHVFYDTALSIRARGMAVFVKHQGGNTVSIRKTTANLLCHDGKYYYQTVSHAFSASVASPDPYDEECDSEYEIISDSDDDDDDETGGIEQMSMGSISSNNTSTYSLSEGDVDDGDDRPGLDRSATLANLQATYSLSEDVDNEDSEPGLDWSASSADLQASLQSPGTTLSSLNEAQYYSNGQNASVSAETLVILGSLIASSTNTDWALIEITDHKVLKYLSSCRGEAVQPDQIALYPQSANVVVHTTSNEPMAGTLSCTSLYTRLPNSSSFQEVYKVKLQGELLKGDCGSIVVAKETGFIYGHVVAGCYVNGLVYIVPAHHVFADIEGLFASGSVPPELVVEITPATVSLPKWQDLLSEPGYLQECVESLKRMCYKDEWTGMHLDDERTNTHKQKSSLAGLLALVGLVSSILQAFSAFRDPSKILASTTSVESTLAIWILTVVLATGGIGTFYEFSTSIPEARISVPRSGGEKNYPNYILRKPMMWLSLIYGILFINLGNISGNTVAFGTYISIAAGKVPDPGADTRYCNALIPFFAILCLTIAALTHIFTRRGGVLINQIFAVVKISILCILLLVGLVQASHRYQQSTTLDTPVKSFLEWRATSTTGANSTLTSDRGVGHISHIQRYDLASHFDAMLIALFSQGLSGQQVSVSPARSIYKKLCSKYFFGELALLCFSYLVEFSNSFLGPTRSTSVYHTARNGFAPLEIIDIFNGAISQSTGTRIVAALMATAVLGNLVAMTFTASRAVLESAKEGIVPSLLFLGSERGDRQQLLETPFEGNMGVEMNARTIGSKEIMAGAVLAWGTSVLLVFTTASFDPGSRYTILTAISSYINNLAICTLLVGSMVNSRCDILTSTCRHLKKCLNWYPPPFAVPTFLPALAVSLSDCIADPVDWVYKMASLRQFSRTNRLIVTRTPHILPVGDFSFVQKAELVEQHWGMGMESKRKDEDTLGGNQDNQVPQSRIA